MANFYLISFDPSTSDSSSLHKVIKDCGFVTWWHYLGSSYIVKTKNRNLADIHKLIKHGWPKNRYLIIKVDPAIRDGWLPPDAWKWFKENVN